MENNVKKTTEKTEEKQKPWLFKKGISGNPNGRPKGSGISIVTEIKRKLAEYPEGSKATYLELLINRIFKQAIQEGDASMIKDMINRVDGMPIQKNQHTGDNDEPIKFIISRNNADD